MRVCIHIHIYREREIEKGNVQVRVYICTDFCINLYVHTEQNAYINSRCVYIYMYICIKCYMYTHIYLHIYMTYIQYNGL